MAVIVTDPLPRQEQQKIVAARELAANDEGDQSNPITSVFDTGFEIVKGFPRYFRWTR
jgi:hypothetical protein